jgi:hypothetical protein
MGKGHVAWVFFGEIAFLDPSPSIKVQRGGGSGISFHLLFYCFLCLVFNYLVFMYFVFYSFFILF